MDRINLYSRILCRIPNLAQLAEHPTVDVKRISEGPWFDSGSSDFIVFNVKGFWGFGVLGFWGFGVLGFRV